MSESAFSNLVFDEENSSLDPDVETEDSNNKEYKERDSIFTILYDSLEQKPYTFRDHNGTTTIFGDYKDDYSPINVKTVKKRLKVGDYSILNLESICIERKSKEDLFSSTANGQKRDNFVERLRKMQSTLKYGAVVVECYKQSLFDDPPKHTSLNPKTVYRSSLSWSLQFPLIHWHWCRDREEAEQVVFRLLEKFWEHETSSKYVHHNKPLDNVIEAFELGIKSRMTSNETEAGYKKDSPLLNSWIRGWNFWSNLCCEGDRGKIWDFGTMPSMIQSASSEKDKRRAPLRGQTSFLEHENDTNGLSDLVCGIEKTIKKKYKSK
jgi:ERCC4-type nuclease